MPRCVAEGGGGAREGEGRRRTRPALNRAPRALIAAAQEMSLESLADEFDFDPAEFALEDDEDDAGAADDARP